MGYIKLNRKFFEHPLWTEEHIYSKGEAWLDLIQSARFEPSVIIVNNNAIDVLRGEVCASLRFLAKRWGWSTKKVSKFLSVLSQLCMIETQKKQGNTVIKLCNYDTYNDAITIEETPKQQQGNTGETPGKQRGNENNKGNKGDEGEVISYSPKRYLISQGVSEECATAWLNYRRIVKKASVSKMVIDNIIKVATDPEINLSINEALELQEHKNWQGFKKEWILNNQSDGNTQKQFGRSQQSSREQEALDRIAARLQEADRNAS